MCFLGLEKYLSCLLFRMPLSWQVFLVSKPRASYILERSYVPAAKILILQFGTEEFALFLGNILYYVSSTSQSKVLWSVGAYGLAPCLCRSRMCAALYRDGEDLKDEECWYQANRLVMELRSFCIICQRKNRSTKLLPLFLVLQRKERM